jgi:NAD(P)-dependent dehydrogenase (short-subunit alcohol dehydrogenase family)
MSLRNKRVVIVGGSSGIGFAVAEAVLAEHGKVIVASSKPANVAAAVQRLSAGATGLVVDVTDEKSVEAAFGQLSQVDHLVFTAGDWSAARRNSLADMNLEHGSAIFAVRFWGAIASVKHAHKALTPGGSITLTNGMIAHRPARDSALTTAMAGAIEHLTCALAVELAPIRVNAVCPGPIRTEVWNGIPEDRREERFQQMTMRQPLARIGEPKEVAEAYLYLMRAGYTTGQILRVDGGSSVV